MRNLIQGTLMGVLLGGLLFLQACESDMTTPTSTPLLHGEYMAEIEGRSPGTRGEGFYWSYLVSLHFAGGSYWYHYPAKVGDQTDDGWQLGHLQLDKHPGGLWIADADSVHLNLTRYSCPSNLPAIAGTYAWSNDGNVLTLQWGFNTIEGPYEETIRLTPIHHGLVASAIGHRRD